MLRRLLTAGVAVLLLFAGGYFAAGAKAAGQEGTGTTPDQVQVEVTTQQGAGEQVAPKNKEGRRGGPMGPAENQRLRGASEQRENARLKAEERQAKREEARLRAEEKQAMREKARLRAKEIRENQQEIKGLRQTIREKTKEARELIKELSEKPEAFPPEKAAAVREKLRQIKENRAKFAETLGQIRDERARLRENRQNQDAPGMRGNTDNIFAVQEARIRVLKAMIADLDELLALLR
jgi:chromosome segregation ATPase